MTRDEALAEAKRFGALKPQGVRESMAANVNEYHTGQPWEQTDRAQQRLQLWADAIQRGEDPRRTVG